MRNAVILHGTADNSKSNWFQWLSEKLTENGINVWVPDLPESEFPNIERYNAYIYKNTPFELNEDTILIGHSSGAVEILGLLQKLDESIQVTHSYLVGAFKDDLDWEALKGLFLKPFDFERIKTKCKKFTYLHSDNDPYCPLEHAKYLSTKLDGNLIVIPGEKHFSISTAGEKYKEFPFLLDLIVKDLEQAM